MRIISGEWKGRRIEAPEAIRPTGDRVRGALFSILGGTLDGLFVDLYAGSGAVGLEARSRGAHAVLVERDPDSLDAIRRNVDALGIGRGLTVLDADVLRLLKDPLGAGVPRVPAEVVFADPPYDYHSHEKLLRLLATGPLAGPDTRIVIERRKGARVRLPEGLELAREETYGTSVLAFHRRTA